MLLASVVGSSCCWRSSPFVLCFFQSHKIQESNGQSVIFLGTSTVKSLESFFGDIQSNIFACGKRAERVQEVQPLTREGLKEGQDQG